MDETLMWIDSHCHLDHNRFLNHGGAEALVANAKENGVEGMLSINCEIAAEFDDLLELVKPLENVWCTIGTHPHDASVEAEKAITVEQIVKRAQSHKKIVGIGESGLDYFYKNSEVEDQHTSFRKHINACIEADLPLVIHARDADEDIIRLMREEAGKNNDRGLRGVMHCFSSGADLAWQALEFGFYISFSGILTFKKSEELREIAKKVPLDRLLVETDAPFLTPEPHRKEMNEPKYVPVTGTCLADVHKMSATKMAQITKDNFFTLFNKAELNGTNA
jgi:TatD DNase family protein